MKKIVIAIIATLALAGCATSVPAPTVTVTATPEVTTPAPKPEPVMTDEEAFIAAVENKYGPLTTKQEKTLIDFAYDVCVSFDTVGVNKTLRYLATLVENNSEAKFMGYVAGAGTAAFCPEYGNALGLGTSA